MKRTPKGFAHLALLLLLVVIAAAVYVGYKEVKNHQQTTADSQTAAKSVSDSIKSPADLDKAAAALNSQNIDGDLNPDGFNSDVSSLQ